MNWRTPQQWPFQVPETVEIQQSCCSGAGEGTKYFGHGLLPSLKDNLNAGEVLKYSVAARIEPANPQILPLQVFHVRKVDVSRARLVFGG
jgi:hypothetical protein